MTFMLLKAVKFHVYPVTQVIYNDAFTLIWPYFDDLLNFCCIKSNHIRLTNCSAAQAKANEVRWFWFLYFLSLAQIARLFLASVRIRKYTKPSTDVVLVSFWLLKSICQLAYDYVQRKYLKIIFM